MARQNTNTSTRHKRCDEHETLDEFVPCPRCEAFLGVVNTFAATPSVSGKDKSLSPSSLQDEHIMVLGVTQGWDKVRTLPTFDEGWEKHAALDSVMALSLRPVERLSTYIARLWWNYVSAPPDQRDLSPLPSFLRPMPAQQSIEHDPVIDVSPFPAFREKLVLGQHRYRSDNFWQRYVEDFRFVWPHNLEDAWVLNLQTNTFEFAPLFRQHVYDPNCWTMLSDFFDIFPELHGDARKFEPQLIVYRNRAMVRGIGGAPPQSRPTSSGSRHGKRKRSQTSNTPSTEERAGSTSHSTTSSVEEVGQAQYLLHGLLNALRYNETDEVGDILDSLRRDGTPQETATHIQQNFEILHHRGIMSRQNLDENGLVGLVSQLRNSPMRGLSQNLQRSETQDPSSSSGRSIHALTNTLEHETEERCARQQSPGAFLSDGNMLSNSLAESEH